uniref:Uncharacterized protein n=1 Tax=Meloidogyne enterolobii TaxID=390850 RepID=A0A6V7UXM0_MELEN|nr:unnamed protein product [Meloidogyne enterolobii]
MSRISTTDSSYFDTPSNTNSKVALRSQIDKIYSHKERFKNNMQISPEKIQELELLLMELEKLIEYDNYEASALLCVKCLVLIEEMDHLSPIPILISPPTPIIKNSLLASNEILQPHFIGDVQTQEDNSERNINRSGRLRTSLWNRITGRSRTNREGITSERDGVRDLWGTQIEFFLSCLGFIVGGGNTLRFPAMIFEFGGAFFIPYVIFMVIFGLPLVYMHLAIGQFSGLSANAAFHKMMPIASGLGWAFTCASFCSRFHLLYFLRCLGLVYLWFALQGLMAAGGHESVWEKCQTDWINKLNCCELSRHRCFFNETNQITAPEAFFHQNIREPALGQIQDHLVISLVFSWILVFFGVFKGLGSIGWAVSITATVPYLLLIILLLRGISLKGAYSGLLYLFTIPDIRRLWCLRIWRKAAECVFYSLGIDAGPLISMASFSRYRNNIYRDAVLLVIIDSFTSILCGVVIFSFFGFMTSAQGIRISDIQDQLTSPSTYIAFTVYPGVTYYLEWGFIWAVLFYTVLTLSALDAEFAWLEMIANSIMNKFGSKRKRLENRLLISLCIFCCLCGIPFCTRGGIYIFHAIENLNSNWNSFSLSLVQVLVVCHVYGVDNFLEDIGEMLRAEKPPRPVLITGISREQFLWHRFCYFFGPCGGYIKWMWSLFAPIVLILLLFASILSYERVRFNNVELPFVFEMIAWITMIGPLLIVPGAAIWNIIEAFRNDRPIKDVFGTNNWRHKEEENKQPKHQDEGRQHLYSYIDPLSRGASAKSNKNISNFSSSWKKEHDDERYARVTQQLRQWTRQAGKSTSESNLTDRPELNQQNYDEYEDTHELRESQYNVKTMSVVKYSMQKA